MATNTLGASLPVSPARTRSLAGLAIAGARIVLGLVFFAFGLNGFLDFIPRPTTPVPDGAMALGMAFMHSGYLFQLIKGTEVLGGLLLLCNRFVPLALAILAPVVVNIFAFHVFLLPEGVVLASVVLVLEVGLAWAHRDAFRPMLAVRSAPRR